MLKLLRLAPVVWGGLYLTLSGTPAQRQESRWLQPAQERGAEPIWGHRNGLAIGLWPTPGPRGLFRIYTPYLGHPRLRMVNYISVEPVVRGRRGQSELERGAVSAHAGLSFWTADRRADLASRTESAVPARGRIGRSEGTETLSVFVATEAFRSGARPIVQVRFRADRPHEVAFRLYASPESEPLEACVLSATMGNYGRLRRLWLKEEVADSRRVWPSYRPDPLGFTPWKEWPREELRRVGKDRVVAATSDEPDPAAAAYDRAVPPHWRYAGRPGTHYWRTRDVPGLEARANGRATYWGEQGPIPGGVSYENFEIQAPFAAGQEFQFGVSPEPPSAFGFSADPRR